MSYMEDEDLYNVWLNKQHLAEINMKKHHHMQGCLIEVAAQHPLVDGIYPGEEFKSRLDLAYDLFMSLATRGSLVMVYVPGSIHRYKGVRDHVSLSSAGCTYLSSRGIPALHLLGDDMNTKYKATDGVYNSSDECYVASRIFEEQEFRDLHCICSPPQLLRKALSYIEFGCIPQFHTVSCDTMYHSYVKEVFQFIPEFLQDGAALQGSSDLADKIRSRRKA